MTRLYACSLLGALGTGALDLLFVLSVLSAQSLPDHEAGTAHGRAARRVVPQTLRQQAAALQEARRLSQKAEREERQGKPQDAERSAERALALEEGVRGPWHIQVAHRLDHLADLYAAHHKEEAAERLYERARAIRERALSTHPDVYEQDNGEMRVRRNQPANKAGEPRPETRPD
jgi:tetratricopeptide (TPR) repeat protein